MSASLPFRIGHDAPKLQTIVQDQEETSEFDLPDYDLRKLITSRDALCCADSFMVAIRVLVAQIFGLRMCPECPRCASSATPCMDMFGSNATAMGGCMGRVDALIGAVEAQKAEGALHLHFFVYPQMTHQFMTLAEIAELFKQQALSVTDMKRFVDHVRCASYPDVVSFEQERSNIEQSWPAYAMDQYLSRPPAYMWKQTAASTTSPWALSCDFMSERAAHCVDDVQAWRSEGQEWLRQRAQRVQHVLSRMNHHIHPVVDEHTGERRPLASCTPKDRPKECKSGFPLDNEMTEVPLLICPCIARERGLSSTGARSRIGTILPSRNHAWLNAAPALWCEVSGDNGDIKLPMRVPIIPETHEKMRIYDVRRCCDATNELKMMYEVQIGQSVTAGYFGGYSTKMQCVGMAGFGVL